MPIFDDDFQSYAIGTNVPFGNWQLNPSAFTAQIVAGGSTVAGTSRNLAIFLGSVILDPLVSGYQPSFTQFIAFYASNNITSRLQIMAFENGPNLGGNFFTIMELAVETDTTISAIDGSNGAILGNTVDRFINRNSWNFLQINVALTDVPVGGVKHVNISLNLGINGISAMNFSTTTGTVATALANGTSQVNRFILSGGNYGAFTLDSLQSMPTYPHIGTAKALVYQAPVEVNVLPSTGKIRIIQAPVEVNVLPSTGKIRVIQALVETDMFQPQGVRAEYIHRRHFPGD